MKALLAKAATKTTKVKFMDTETVEVRKLTVSQVKDFQAKLEANKGKEDVDTGLSLQRDLIRLAVIGADELTDEEMDQFPLDDITKLFDSILRLAGVKGEAAAGNA